MAAAVGKASEKKKRCRQPAANAEKASESTGVSPLTGDEYRHTFGSDGTLTAEERREMTLVNLARSKASKAKRKKQRRQKAAEKRLTEAEKREKEQQRIRSEREMRRSLSEANRRDAGMEGAEPDPDPEHRSAPERYPEQKMPPEENDPIDIKLPEEPDPRRDKAEKPAASKEKAKDKQPAKRSGASVSRAAGGRYKDSKPRTKDANRITAGGAIMFGVLTTVLIGLVIYGRVQTNEVYTDIAELQAEYDDLVAQNVSMKSEMEGKMTVKKIQEYAENELHLMPLNQSQIEYIQLQTEDEVTISQPKESFFVRINDYLRRFWEFLSGK